MEGCESIMTTLEGKWKLHHEKNDNFEEYMKAVGIAMPFRKMGKKLTPIEEIKKINDTRWSLDLSVAIRRSQIEFELGQAIEETTLDGRPCKTTFTVENDELLQYQRSLQKGIPDTCIHRQRTDAQTVIQTWEAVGTGIKAVRKYILQEK